MAGYTSSYVKGNGEIIDADDAKVEFAKVEDAFDSTGGHSHDGSPGDGASIDSANVVFDDTVALLGSVTVQGALDALDVLVDANTTNIGTNASAITATETVANAALPRTGGTMVGPLVLSGDTTTDGLIDGRDVAADGSALDAVVAADIISDGRLDDLEAADIASDILIAANTTAVYAIPNRNLLINGGFDIWQRGITVTSPTTSNEYNTADRWRFRRGSNAANMVVEQSTSFPDVGFPLPLKVSRTNGDTLTDLMVMGTQIETKDWEKLQGKTVTLSARLRLGSAFSAASVSAVIQSGTAVDEACSLAGVFPTGAATILSDAAEIDVGILAAYQTVSWTFTVPTDSREAQLRLSWTPVGPTATDEDSIRFAWFKLEEGSVATSFIRAGGTVAGELALCQRYYEARSSMTWAFYETIGQNARGEVSYMVEKRSTPTLVFDGGALFNVTSTGTNGSDERGFNWSALVTATGHAVVGNSASAFFTADAEL